MFYIVYKVIIKVIDYYMWIKMKLHLNANIDQTNYFLLFIFVFRVPCKYFRV